MHMLFQVSSSVEKRNARDALVIPFWKKEGSLVPACDAALFEEEYAPVLACGDFQGNEGECICLWSKNPAEKRIFLLGLGSEESLTAEQMRRSWSVLTRLLIHRKIKSANILFPNYPVSNYLAKASIEGLLFGTYVFDKYKHDALKEKPTSHIECLTLLTPEIHATHELCDSVQKVLTAVFFARDLVNGNADEVTPEYLAQAALDLAKTFPRVTAEI